MDHILIVEDDRALSQGIRLALDQAGRQFTQCHTLRETEEALAARPPQLVILDLNLPDGNGLDLLRRLRASSPCRCSSSPPTTWRWTRCWGWSWGRTTM